MEAENPNPEAVEKENEKAKFTRLTSAEDLEELMQIVTSKSWLTLSTSFAIIFIALVWSFFGTIPIKVKGSGISLTQEGPYVITTSIAGTVNRVYATAGQLVGEGTLIARLQNASLALDIQLKKEQIQVSENDLQAYNVRIESEDAARKSSIQKQIEATQLAMKSAQSKIPFLEKDLASKIRLEQIGILAPRDVENARNALQQAHLDIESNMAQVSSLQAQFSKSYAQDEINAKKAVIDAQKDELARLELQDKFLNVYAGKTGKVLEIVVSAGDHVDSGMEIASLELPLQKGQLLQYVACYGAEFGESLDVNLKTEIEVSGVDPKEYGYLLGTTQFITPYPVTSQELMAQVKNKDIVDFLKDDNKLVYLAIIRLDQDPHTQSGYRWSTGQGPPWLLDSGTTGTVLTITDEKPPIMYILPDKIAPYIFRHLSKDTNP